jgi:hypothetical protein
VTFVVLFLLAVVWAVYLASWLRGRSEHRSVNSISSFSKHLSVLERTSPGHLGRSPVVTGSANPATNLYAPRRTAGMSLSEARRRRRDVLFALGGAALVTLMLAVVAGGVFLWAHLLADALLAAYVVLLVRSQQLANERRAKVRYLGGPVSMPNEAAYYLSQSASAN